MTIEGLTFVGVLVAFAGGLVSFISPCVLPLVPIYLGHLSGVLVQDGKIQGGKTTFYHSVGFVLGFSIIFIILGATVGVLGGTAGGNQETIARVAGIMLMAFGVYMAGVFRLPVLRSALAPATEVLDRVYYRERCFHVGSGRPSYWRSFAVGSVFAVGWAPCITPVLGAILTVAYTSSSGVDGWAAAGNSAVLLTFYTAGLSIPFLIAGAALGRIAPCFKKITRYFPAITVGSGILMVFVGWLVYANLVVRLNEYFGFLPYVDF
jgi:cytochrome c-type biogenesis protein